MVTAPPLKPRAGIYVFLNMRAHISHHLSSLNHIADNLRSLWKVTELDRALPNVIILHIVRVYRSPRRISSFTHVSLIKSCALVKLPLE